MPCPKADPDASGSRTTTTPAGSYPSWIRMVRSSGSGWPRALISFERIGRSSADRCRGSSRTDRPRAARNLPRYPLRKMAIEPVDIGDVAIGPGRPLALVAGPCVIESADHCLKLAAFARDICKRLGLG